MHTKTFPLGQGEVLIATYDADCDQLLFKLAADTHHGDESLIPFLTSARPDLDSYEINAKAIAVLTDINTWLSTMVEREPETDHREARQLDRFESLRHEGSAA